jgi:hypothetical protein
MAPLVWGPVRSWLALAVCGLALAGCSGTRLGDQLSRSFSAPPAQPVSPNPAAPNRATPTPAAPNPEAPKGVNPKLPGAPTTAKPGAAPLAPRLSPAASAAKPAPYRITIQLPAADPAAPAEAVTEALRAAGVSFEVEMIERIGASTPKPAPTVTPAPAPR